MCRSDGLDRRVLDVGVQPGAWCLGVLLVIYIYCMQVGLGLEPDLPIVYSEKWFACSKRLWI